MKMNDCPDTKINAAPLVQNSTFFRMFVTYKKVKKIIYPNTSSNKPIQFTGFE